MGHSMYRIMYKTLVCSLLFLIQNISVEAQTNSYQSDKEEKLRKESPFTKIINRELPATIEYEDDDLIAFVPLRKQAPVHLLIVPKKPIPTINDLKGEDTLVVGRMVVLAKQLAKSNGIAKTGYRLAFNTNEDAGQSVFHIHLHLLGGKNLGPMVSQDYDPTK